jgi:hypothetical protein
MRTFLLSLLAILGSNLLFIWWGRTTFVPLGLVVVGSLLLAILLGVLGAIVYGFSRRTMNDHTRLTLRSLVVAIVFFSSTALGLPLVHRVIERDLRITRARVDDLAERLSARYAMTGSYPDSLQPVAGQRPLPRLLTRSDAFHSTGTSYYFRLRIPGHPTAGEIYRNQDPIWRAD